MTSREHVERRWQRRAVECRERIQRTALVDMRRTLFTCRQLRTELPSRAHTLTLTPLSVA